MQNQLNQLTQLTREAYDLQGAINVLAWDQQTYLLPAGAAARGRQLALLTRLHHERATDPAIGRLLDALQPAAERLPYDHDDAALVRAARRDYERQIKIPSAFAAELAEHQALSYQAWAEARPANDFKKVQPLLEKTLDYSRRLAQFFPGYQHIADPLIAMSDYGLHAQDVRRVFAELRAGLVPLIQKIGARPQVDDTCLHQTFPRAAQMRFSEEIARQFGLSAQRGRIDLAQHPFTIFLALDDVRITTRIQESDLGDCLFSVLHETGHALYELGLNPAYEGSPLNGYVSSGVHESQSRTWENLVGRSQPFWEYAYPKLQATFPEQLGQTNLETFYRAINRVAPSLIRTDADEVTYNLHPLIRFDLELALLEGTLAVRDLPEAWNARYESDLGLRPTSDHDGVLQDVHWFDGWVGGLFQGYTLGNILSAMFYEQALLDHPTLPDEIRQGHFETLLAWLTGHIYRHGAKYTTSELVQRITGGSLSVEPLLRYLNHKYGEIYSL